VNGKYYTLNASLHLVEALKFLIKIDLSKS
jgi:hypothetical protein